MVLVRRCPLRVAYWGPNYLKLRFRCHDLAVTGCVDSGVVRF
jgi:hypothetical protein